MVASDADRDALHVDMADEAVRIGPAAADQRVPVRAGDGIEALGRGEVHAAEHAVTADRQAAGLSGRGSDAGDECQREAED